MALTLPYPSMNFVPLDVLTAQQQNQLVANIQHIATNLYNTTSSYAIYTSSTPSTDTNVPEGSEYTYGSQGTITTRGGRICAFGFASITLNRSTAGIYARIDGTDYRLANTSNYSEKHTVAGVRFIGGLTPGSHTVTFVAKPQTTTQGTTVVTIPAYESYEFCAFEIAQFDRICDFFS